MSDIIQRFTQLMSAVSGTLGTSAIQVSGGPASSWPLTGVSAAYYPNYHRQGIRIVCLTAGASIYIDSQSSVSSSSFSFVATEGAPVTEMVNGSVPRWIVASQANVSFRIEEYQ